MTILPDRLPVLDDLVLEAGSHKSWSDGACVLEAVAYIAGEPWSDHPECASPIIGAFLRTWNDALDTDDCQALKQYIPRLVGSRGTAVQEDARAWLVLDWLVRVHTPAWLRLSGLTSQADQLAGLPEFRAGMDVAPLRPTLEAVREDAAAAWAAAGDAAWDAAGDAAGDAARDAARAAARDAAWAVLRPTVVELQASAHQLVDRMLAVTETTVPMEALNG
ncbi:MAG: hypothetical protein ACRD0W_09650 [Acidimicrobiales bacterium]